jgi:hypothetical protein
MVRPAGRTAGCVETACECTQKAEGCGLSGAIITHRTINSSGSAPVFIRISGFRSNPVKYTDPDGNSGELTIYASGNGLLDGHAWISFTSDETGETITYGTWGNNPEGLGNGLHENLEKGYGAEATRTANISDDQEAALMKTIGEYKAKGAKGWGLLSPCSEFAKDAWDSATGEYLNANTAIIVNNPETLKSSIIKQNGGEANGTLVIPDGSSASRANSNSSARSSGSVSAGSGGVINSSLQPIYDNSF